LPAGLRCSSRWRCRSSVWCRRRAPTFDPEQSREQAAGYAQRPAKILMTLNQRMAGRAAVGFTTCLVLRVDGDGRSAVANAGHLHPDRTGNELSVENGLSPGVSAEAEYAETVLTWREGAQMTLLTGGVVEARSKVGRAVWIRAHGGDCGRRRRDNRSGGAGLRAERRYHRVDAAAGAISQSDPCRGARNGAVAGVKTGDRSQQSEKVPDPEGCGALADS